MKNQFNFIFYSTESGDQSKAKAKPPIILSLFLFFVEF